MRDEVEKFEATKSKGAVIFIASFPALLGLLMLVGFLDRIPYLDAEAFSLLVFAALFIGFAILFWRYSFNPPFLLSSRELTIRRFFGAKTIPYDSITSLGKFSKTFRPRKPGGGKMMTILTTHHLVIKTRDGKENTHTLPSFAGNQRLLESLARRSGKTIEALPDEVEKGLNPPS